MKKMLLIGFVVVMVLAMAAPAAFAGRWPPSGNNTNVTVYGRHNSGMILVNGSHNNTNLYFAPGTRYNMGMIGVMGCGNNTNVRFGYGAKYNSVGVMVFSPCRR